MYCCREGVARGETTAGVPGKGTNHSLVARYASYQVPKIYRFDLTIILALLHKWHVTHSGGLMVSPSHQGRI